MDNEMSQYLVTVFDMRLTSGFGGLGE